MDITEAFRSEDLTKTDFFDFVVTPDASDSQTLQQFSKQMRTVNAFLGNANTDIELKETNNNMLTSQMTDVPTSTETATNYDPNFWSDKETVRLETAILEDLNKYCWSPDQDAANGKLLNNNNNNNTDGHIYTLTVLNGVDQNATWYRPPLASIGIVKEEDGSMSSPSPMENLQSGLDIDSIFSIIPGQLNGFNNNYSEHALSPNTDGLIKSEPYSYEDSGYADNKDELASSLIIDTPLLEAHDNFNNNNNDWKLSNNNNGGTADSLLRSALQGKAFVRYNGTAKTVKQEPNSELRRVLSTPPSKTDSPLFPSEKENDQQQQQATQQQQAQQPQTTIIAGITDGTNTVLFDENPTGARITDSDNPSSTHSVEDMILSQLDSVSYPEDYEKLKRIANEVAESVQQFCQIDPVENAIFSISPDQIGILNNISAPIIAAPVVTSTKTQSKKYKRSNSGTKQTTVQNATSTSNGVRKERSLHYCSICSKGFKDKYSVNVHIRTHTGEKPFSCSLCGKSFRQKAHLAKHYQTHIAQKNAAAAGNVASAKAKSR